MASPGQQPQPAAATPALARLAAQSQTDFELDFFAALLERRPDYVEALKAHAKNLAMAKRHQEGLQIDWRITRLKPQDALAHYNLACSYALLKRPDQSLKTLRRAVELGYRDFRYMCEDHDLDSVRQDPRFRQLLREFGAR
jgi:tetratricopeptide (TPR) repeat protein